MDTDTIDQQYNQLQAEFQDVAQSVQGLPQKLQAAEQAGDANAKEWLLDLKQIALDVKDEQMQVNALLQAIHGFVANAAQAPAQAPPMAAPQQPVYQQAPAGYVQQPGGGMFGGFLNSGFGRAIELGAGIGLGQDMINSIF